MARIALVEDDPVIATLVRRSLERQGHELRHFDNGAVGFKHVQQDPPEVLILDVGVPGMDGLEVCRRMRLAFPGLPIVMLTARGEEVERVVGLETGADDYIVKPFSAHELVARVRALLRRAALPPVVERSDEVESGPFHLDTRTGTVTLPLPYGSVLLTRREADLLALLLRNAPQVVNRKQLIEQVWGDDLDADSKTLEVHIRWLRMKLEEDPAEPRHILTVRGRGYRFSPD